VELELIILTLPTNKDPLFIEDPDTTTFCGPIFTPSLTVVDEKEIY
jgi:hypothetical protein